jgi:hypothetical protein
MKGVIFMVRAHSLIKYMICKLFLNLLFAKASGPQNREILLFQVLFI